MNKANQLRQINWRIKLLKYASETGNVARTCRHFGISRKSFYKWVRRHEEYGDAGLCDRSKKPKTMPRSTPKEIVSKVLYLRQNYHFGPGRIAAYLARYHQIKIAVSTVHAVLKRHNLSTRPQTVLALA